MMNAPTSKKVVLASNSPRRRQLLRDIIPNFTVAESRSIDESYPEGLTAEEIAPFLSKLKADAYADLIDNNTLLITADTIVIIDGRILGKPRDGQEALEMLKTLSGNMHTVVTGVTLRSKTKSRTFSCATQVYFDKIPEHELIQYIETFNPIDKAGAYGIQEWIGCRGINKIDGCFYNVMGLPLNRLYNEITEFERD